MYIIKSCNNLLVENQLCYDMRQINMLLCLFKLTCMHHLSIHILYNDYDSNILNLFEQDISYIFHIYIYVM